METDDPLLTDHPFGINQRALDDRTRRDLGGAARKLTREKGGKKKQRQRQGATSPEFLDDSLAWDHGHETWDPERPIAEELAAPTLHLRDEEEQEEPEKEQEGRGARKKKENKDDNYHYY
jgi:hypothetical protein